jgi:hypothetical protein
MNESVWICSKLNIESIDKIRSIINFPVIWNIFEKKYFDCDYKPSKIISMYSNNIRKMDLISSDTNFLLDIFKRRYCKGSQFSDNFDSLYLRDNDDEETVKKVLKGEPSSPEIVFKVIITIISRFRNNYFHGLKGPGELRTQNNIFSSINEYLSKIIDA